MKKNKIVKKVTYEIPDHLKKLFDRIIYDSNTRARASAQWEKDIKKLNAFLETHVAPMWCGICKNHYSYHPMVHPKDKKFLCPACIEKGLSFTPENPFK